MQTAAAAWARQWIVRRFSPSSAQAATAEEIRAMTRRYIAPEDVEAYIARWPDLRTIVDHPGAHRVMVGRR